MSKKNKKEEVKAEIVVSDGPQELAPKLSTYIEYASKKLEAIAPGHREIDIAARDAISSLEKAVDLVKFIESIQGK